MYIKDIIIINPKNQEANQYEFDNKANLIVSANNSQGKSSLIKSLYYALGFDIKKFPDEWDAENMIFKINIFENGNSYGITRYQNKLKFDNSDFMSIYDYSLKLQDILNIDMQLTNKRTKRLENAYSSAYILPFYVDQDDSWGGKPYSGVTNAINMYTDVPKSILEYIFGLSTEEIQDLENEKKSYTSKINKLNSQTGVLEEYKREELNKYDSTAHIAPLNADKLKMEIDYYLRLLTNFNEEANKFKAHIIKNKNQINNLDQEINELQQLLKLYKGEYKDIESFCSYCNSHLTKEQSLKRLKVNSNIIHIQDMIILLKEDKKEAQKRLNKYQSKQNDIDKKVDHVKQDISKSEALLNIHNYVESAAKEKTINNLINNINSKYKDIESLKKSIKKINYEIKEIKNNIKSRKELLSNEYTKLTGKMNTRLSKVTIDKLDLLQFKDVGGSGMVTNKTLFAYYLIYFNLIKKFGRYKLPFGLDSFIKNESSVTNKDEMFELVEDYLLSINTQSFFSILYENLIYFKKSDNYHHIVLKDRVLNKHYYQKNKDKINNILD